jgi:hypothetical protein
MWHGVGIVEGRLAHTKRFIFINFIQGADVMGFTIVILADDLDEIRLHHHNFFPAVSPEVIS